MSPEIKKTASSFNFSEFIKTKEFIGGIVGLLGAYFLFPFFFEVYLFPLGIVPPDPSTVTDLNFIRIYPWLSLDPSWSLALNKFNMDNLVWGKDISFTYGPLAYLSTRIGWGISKYHLVLFDLFVWFNFFYIFYKAYVKTENKKVAVLLIVATCFFLPSSFAAGLALVMLAFLIFWIRQSLDESRPLNYVMQILIIVLLFFIKFNTSLISFFLFFVALAYKIIFTKERKLLLLTYLAIPVLLVSVFSKILNVSIPDYLMGGLNMVSGYNEIMYLALPVVIEFKYTCAIIFISLFIILWKMYLEKKQNIYKNLVIFGMFTLAIYVLYKQSFVRNDPQHIMDFNKFSLLLIICVQDFYYKQIGKFSHWLIVAIVFFSFLFSKKRDDHLFKLNERVFKTRYVKGFANFSDTSGIRLFPNVNQIPDSIKNKIGQSSVDIYPWNIHLLIENKLNYTPRPVIQAYTAYTPYLENLNFDFYNSDKAPEYVLYDYDVLDNRYALFDESKVNLTILKNYEFINYFHFAGRPTLVLKKKTGKHAKINFQKIREFDMTSFDAIQPKEDSYYELFVSNTLRGAITSFLSHSPEMFLVITTKDGSRREFKISKKLLETGIFSNRLFNSTQDIFNYLVIKDAVKPENEVVSYSLRFGNPQSFDNNIRVIEYKIN